MDVILAIDGGGSRTRCLAIDREGRLRGAGAGGASNHLLVEDKIVRESLACAIDAALAQAGLDRNQITCLSAGLAGVDYDGRAAGEMENLLAALGFPGALVSGDMVIAHAGALAGEPGVLALAGTGSSILGIDAGGRRVKIGGWGPVYGDEGSAYRIGQQALRAAARDFDGRGPATALTAALLKALGLADFRQTIDWIYVQNPEPRAIAALSRTAYEVAEAGDEVARWIFLEAGEELADSAAAAIRRLELSGARVSYQGAVLLNCGILRERFTATLKSQFPETQIRAPRLAPVAGAYLLGRRRLGWEIDENVLQRLEEQNGVD